jgi:Na+-transporting methylmalonyl-CoA/oxaloacetate decarboxylase gamma subunit
LLLLFLVLLIAAVDGIGTLGRGEGESNV